MGGGTVAGLGGIRWSHSEEGRARGWGAGGWGVTGRRAQGDLCLNLHFPTMRRDVAESAAVARTNVAGPLAVATAFLPLLLAAGHGAGAWAAGPGAGAQQPRRLIANMSSS